MKKLGIYIGTVLIITIILPTVIVKTFNFVPRVNSVVGESLEEDNTIETNEITSVKDHEYEVIKVYNSKTGETEELKLDEYIKGVVAAEMPAAFHIEALKAQAVAARTYAISRSIRFADGHPEHKSAPLCTGIHCQAYLSLEQLRELHGESWMEEYWGKIEESVNSTKNLAIFYNGEIIEPLYHSTAGGRTEDAKDVFAVESPYLKSVTSPYEEEAPKFKDILTLTLDEFIKKIQSKYPDVKITKDNIQEKIKLIDRTLTGRVKKIAIDGIILEGRDLRDLFALNSTNFTISLDKKLNIIEIETYGYGHGVGMSQWGANGMGKHGSTYEEILKHYYTEVEIKEIDN
ncbi:stage II sporulation protein D [Tissierella pigra]|uniref:Stage II sporulation protein D n=1 Tax=Tissierella pigra TaxID=2607614 RepID=A0A6N7XUJ4_9FIRM|nr:stage II sporulation protein D [Tissierella pigra]MBU5427829.1 stage II sporulation protein D [Tissierella pigra]MSU00155.1 stage II sporulation protein D [Tissierella pigra]